LYVPYQVNILTNKEAFQYALQTLKPLMGEGEANATVKYLFFEQYDLSKTVLLTHEMAPFAHTDHLNETLARLIQNQPLQYILGFAYFNGLKINVNPAVLIPRPETEELIALAKTRIVNANQMIADICTGSGCIAIAMRQWFPNNPIIATDISESALATAKSSAALNFNNNTIQFRQHDVLTQAWPFEIPDIVICNPPYINRTEGNAMAPHVLLHEPHLALFVDHPDPLLFYKSLIQTFLPGAFPNIFFEMNPNYVEGLKHYCTLHQLSCEIELDMQGKERFAIISKGMN